MTLITVPGIGATTLNRMITGSEDVTPRVVLTCNPNESRGDRNLDAFINTSCFALPAPFSFGTAPRNSVRAPGYENVDVALTNTAALFNGVRIQLRWEVFNLLNRVNFDVPNRTFGTANFGRIFSAQSPRQMQFGAKLIF